MTTKLISQKEKNMKFISKEKGITLILLIVVIVSLSIIITLITSIIFSSKSIGTTDSVEENLIREICRLYPR